MVRITSDEHDDCVLLRVEGSLRGLWVDELERLWRCNRKRGKRVCVNLADVPYVDDAGEALLTRMFEDGSELRASGLYMTAIVQEIMNNAGNPAMSG